MQTAAMAVGGLVVAAAAAKWVLDTPSRTYTGKETVGKEYDAWTDDGVLEHYWGEHIHLGYYSDKVLPHAEGRRVTPVVAVFTFEEERCKAQAAKTSGPRIEGDGVWRCWREGGGQKECPVRVCACQTWLDGSSSDGPVRLLAGSL